LSIGVVDGVGGITAGGNVTIDGGTGSVSVAQAIGAGANEVRLNGGAIALGANIAAGTAVLNATGAITQTAGIISAAELGVKGNSIADLATSGVGTFAAEVTGAGGLIFVDDAGGLIVGEVGGISGITTTGGNVSVTTTDGMLTVANAVSAGEADPGTVSLSSQGAGAAIDVQANVTASGLTLDSGGGISQTGGTVIDAGTLTVTAAGDVVLTSTDNLVDELTADAGSADFAFANGQQLTIGTGGVKTVDGTIGLSAADGLTVAGSVDSGTGGTIVLETSGTLRQEGTGSFQAAEIGLRAATTEGLSLPDVDMLAVDLTGAGGGFTHSDADGLRIGTVQGVGGIADIVGIKTNNGAVDVSSATGDLIVADAVTAGTATVNLRATAGDLALEEGVAAGAATLEAQGAIEGTAGAVIEADSLRLRGGTIGFVETQTVGRLDAETTASGDLVFANDGDLVLDTILLADGKASLRTVSGDLTLAGDVSATEVVLDAAGALKRTGGTVAAARLGVRGQSIAALDASGIETFAAEVTGAGQGLSFIGTDPLTIGTVGGISGVTTEDGAIQVAGTGGLTIDAGVNAGTGAVTLTAGGGDALLTANAGIAGGGVTLRADRMALNGAIDGGTGDVALAPTTAGTTIALGALGDAPGAGLRLSGAELDRIEAGTLRVGSSAAGTITVADAIAPAGTDTLSLITGGGVAQGTGAVIDIAQLAVDAGGTVGLTAPNAIDVVAAKSAAGDINIENGGAITIGAVDGIDGISVADTRAINVTADGDLRLAADVRGHEATLSSTAGILQTGGVIDVDQLDVTSRDDLALNQAGNRVGALSATVTGPGSDLVFIGSTGFLTNGAIAVDGSVTLRAENGTLTVGGDIGAGAGDATLSATDDIVFHPGVTVAADDGLVSMDAGGQISALGDLTVNSGRGFTLTSDFVGAGATTIDADHDGHGEGRFAIAAGRRLTNAAALTIVARDVDIGSGGVVEAGSATIRPSRVNTGFVIGDGIARGGSIGLSGAELAAFRTAALSLHGTGSAAIGVGEVKADHVDGIGRLSLAAGGAIDFWSEFDGAVDLDIRTNGDVTFHEDVGTGRRLGDVSFVTGGDVAIEKMFVAGDMTVDIAGDFHNVNQAIRLNQAIGLDLDSLYIENAQTFEAFGTVGGRRGRAVALVIGTRERSNQYTANGCVVGDLTSCSSFGVRLPTARFDLSRDLDELFTTEEEEDEEREDLLFSNGGNEELW
ncbi:MAG TPA: hypothetical protein VFO41_12120, partial [Alphaproteobacteria bacterium]|nr:hypothetical protein [Alphaproteobacteria bacterium]